MKQFKFWVLGDLSWKIMSTFHQKIPLVSIFENILYFNFFQTMAITVILEHFNIKEKALSNFAFQSFYIFISTQDNNNFSIPVRDSLGLTKQGTAIPAYSEKLPKWHFFTHRWNLNFLGPNDFIWSTMKAAFCDFFQNVSQAPSMFISMWIKVNK